MRCRPDNLGGLQNIFEQSSGDIPNTKDVESIVAPAQSSKEISLLGLKGDPSLWKIFRYAARSGGIEFIGSRRNDMHGSFTTASIFAIGSALIGIRLIFWAVPPAGPRNSPAEKAKITPTIYRVVGVFFVLLSVLFFGILTGYLK
jgi:hypothetical protein